MTVYTEIREIIGRELAVEEEIIVSGAHLQDDLGADSLGLLNLAAAIGEKYGIELLGDDLVDLESVDALISLVQSKVAGKTG